MKNKVLTYPKHLPLIMLTKTVSGRTKDELEKLLKEYYENNKSVV